MIAPGIKRRSSPSRPNAVEERDIFLRLKEARHALVLCAKVPGDNGRAVDVARITDLGRIRVALKKERFRPGAGGAHRAEEQRKKQQPAGGAVKRPQSEAASINDCIN